MKTKMTINGVSVCPTAEERHEHFTLSFPAQEKTTLPIRLPRCGRRAVLLRRPDLGGMPGKTGYMVDEEYLDTQFFYLDSLFFAIKNGV